jgi:acyl-CoA thioesterase FadM
VQGFRRIWARRRSEFRSGAGVLLAEADIDWVLTSADGRPTRVPDEIVQAFPGLDAEYRPARLELPTAPPDAVEHERRAEAHEVDPMGHVNNAAYLDQFETLLDALGSAALRTAVPRRYRVEYLSPAPAGSGLRWIAWPTATGIAGTLSREPGGDAVARVLAEGKPVEAEVPPDPAPGPQPASKAAQASAATSG